MNKKLSRAIFNKKSNLIKNIATIQDFLSSSKKICMKRILLYSILTLLVGLVGCSDNLDLLFNNCIEDLEYTEYQINFDKIIGFDDFSSQGAAFVVAIDTNKNAALIMALKFELPGYDTSFIPSCNPIETTLGYDWTQTNTIESDVTREYPYLSEFLTSTSGIRNMNQDISAFLVIKGNDQFEKQIFVAIDGEVNLTRTDDPSDIIEGELSFIEMSESDSTALIKENAKYYSLKNIYIQWDTNN